MRVRSSALASRRSRSASRAAWLPAPPRPPAARGAAGRDRQRTRRRPRRRSPRTRRARTRCGRPTARIGARRCPRGRRCGAAASSGRASGPRCRARPRTRPAESRSRVRRACRSRSRRRRGRGRARAIATSGSAITTARDTPHASSGGPVSVVPSRFQPPWPIAPSETTSANHATAASNRSERARSLGTGRRYRPRSRFESPPRWTWIPLEGDSEVPSHGRFAARVAARSVAGMNTLTALTSVVGSHGEHDGYWFPFAFFWLVLLGLGVWFIVRCGRWRHHQPSDIDHARGSSPSASPEAS